MSARRYSIAALGVTLCIFAAIGVLWAVPHTAAADTLTAEQRASLQAEYDQLQAEIAQWQQVITDTQAKKKTLTGDVTALNAQISKAQAEIKQRNLTISKLSTEINEKSARISVLEQQIQSGLSSMAKIIREKSAAEETSLPLQLLTVRSLSDFFADVAAADAITNELQIRFTELRDNKTATEQEKASLAEKQNAQVDARYEVQAKQQQIEANKQEKQDLLTETAKNESNYQKVLAERQAKAAAINAALFPLRDAAAISFGVALKYAQAAQKKTGVDAALILAILTQESNLGENVGQCYMTDDATGNGVGKNTGKAFKGVMSPTRDVPPFLALAKKLGFDAHAQVVSCPIASVGGWGGAMGPAQFIPSTWALYADRLASDLGVAVANPWEPQHAVMAMAELLEDNGATAGSYTSNYKAAARYYAGWNGPNTSAGKSYATQVMAKVSSIQENIDFLNGI